MKANLLRLTIPFFCILAISCAIAMADNAPSTTSAMPGPVKLDPPDFHVKIKPELLGQHPRIFFTASELDAIRAKVKDPKLAPMMKWLMDDTDKTLARPIPATEEEVDTTDIRHFEVYIEQLAFAYLITGDVKYLEADKKLIHAVANWDSWKGDLDTGHLLFGLAVAYDWLYKDLSPAERQEIEAALLKHGRALLRDPATGKPAWWNTAYFQNHCWINHTGISTAAMALYDVHPEEMQSWLDDSRTTFEQTYKHIGLDGGYHEGASYARYGTTWMLYYVDSLRHVTGENLFNMPFLQKAGNYFCNTVMPDGANLANFGDCPPTAWGYPIEGQVLVKLAAEYKDGHLVWLRDHNHPFYEKTPPRDLMESPFAMIWVDPSVEPKPLDDLPLIGLFPDLGLVIARTSWKDDASVVALHCGAPGGQHLVEETPKIKNATANNGHTHPDANSFVFWSDHGWRIGLPGAYTYVKATHNENTWLVGGKGQRGDNLMWFEQKSYMGKSDQAHLSIVATTPQADYLVGEAAAAYPEELGLTQYTRHLLFVKGASPYIVVFDQLAAKTPQTWASYLHTYGEPKIEDGSNFNMAGVAAGTPGPTLPISTTYGSFFGPGKMDVTAQPLMVLREHTKDISAHGFEITTAPQGSSAATWLVSVVGGSKDIHLVKPGPAPEITVGADHVTWDATGKVSLNGTPITGNLMPPPDQMHSAAATNVPVQKTADKTKTSALNFPRMHAGFVMQSLAVLELAQAAPSNLISNGDFFAGVQDWKTQSLEDATGAFEVQSTDDGKKALYVNVTKAGTKRYYVQFLHDVSGALSAGKTYKLSFRAKAKPDALIVAVIQSSTAPGGSLLKEDQIQLSEGWQDYSYTFTPGADSAKSDLLISGLAVNTGEFWFADFKLEEVASDAASSPAPASVPTPPASTPAPAPGSATSEVPNTTPPATTPAAAPMLATDSPELLANGDFSNGTQNWQTQAMQDGKGSFDVKDGESGKKALCVTVTQAGTKRYFVQFMHPVYTVMGAGSTYTLSFRAKGNPANPIVVTLNSSTAQPPNMLKEDPVQLTTDWQTFSYPFTVGAESKATWLTVSGLAAATGEYWFSDFSLKETANNGTTPAPAPTAAAAPVEKTPTSLPGAEAFVYRDGTPDPMRLFVYKPSGWKATDKRPAMVFFFGGGWTHGNPGAGADFARMSTANGWVGIAPDYRTKTRFNTSPLASVADSRASLHWVQQHAAELGIDPARIVVGGHSAGGHVAIWTAITKTPPESDPNEAPLNKPAALFLLAPVSDTSPTGYTPYRFGENALALSPVHQLDGKMPPTMLVHGDADKVVPYKESVALNAALLKNGAVCEFDTVPGGSHSFPWEAPDWNTHKLMDKLMAFLKANGISTDPIAPAAK